MTAARARRSAVLLSTGGTITAREGENGLAPACDGVGLSELLDAVTDAFPSLDITAHEIFSLDSTNVQPEQWPIIAREAFDVLRDHDGAIITHGTDTMAYTAAALSFMMRNLTKPVVVTGAQIPYGAPFSDAAANIQTAAAAVESGISGVTVAFGGLVINGTRAVKTNASGLGAFESVNAPPMAHISAGGLRVKISSTAVVEPGAPSRLDSSICPDVALVKLAPGTKPELIRALPELGIKGVVVEAYGLGHVNFEGRDLVSAISSVREAGAIVVVTSQCARGRADLTRYEVGRRLMNLGVIPAADMTTEAAVVKLMWALGRASDLRDPLPKVASTFATCYAGEISIG